MIFIDYMYILYGTVFRPESLPFREPMSWKELGLLDYPKIIKKPMDLGTIKRKLESGEYAECQYPVEECAADIRLVWTNCMTYNQDGSEFYHLALTFAKKFEDVYSQFRKLHKIILSTNIESIDNENTNVERVVEDTNRIPTLDERLQLSYDIFRISQIEMGIILTLIEKESPSAVSYKGGSADEVLINFDIMAPPCFHQISKIIQGYLTKKKSNKKKRSLEDSTASTSTSTTSTSINKSKTSKM